MDVVIYHNPACGTSRNALSLIRDAGIEPIIVDYLRNPPDFAVINRPIVITASGAALCRPADRVLDLLK
jgi:arsenate reductase-like glutaredoxin family protein